MDEICTPHDRYFRESFGRLEIARDFLRHNLPALHDISVRTNAEIKGEVLTRLVQLAMRHIYSKEPREPLRELLSLIVQIADQTAATEILHTLLRYYIQANTRLDEEDVRILLNETLKGEATMQTFLGRYIEQGRQQGRQQGRLEGRQEGRQEGEAALLLRLIERRFGPASESVRERVATADPETLLCWSE